MTKRIGIIAGSSRKSSYSVAVANSLVALFPEEYELVFPQIDELVMFNADYERGKETPPLWREFRNGLRDIDGVVFVTPEYNRSIPPLLKNALDIASRPSGSNLWDGKPAAIISLSTENISGFGANHHLRQVLTFLNMPTLQQPEAYLSSIDQRLTADGKLQDETRQFLQEVIDSYVIWFEKLAN